MAIEYREWREGDDLALLEIWGDPETAQAGQFRGTLGAARATPRGGAASWPRTSSTAWHPGCRRRRSTRPACTRTGSGPTSRSPGTTAAPASAATLLAMLRAEAEQAPSGVREAPLPRWSRKPPAPRLPRPRGLTQIQRSRVVQVSPGALPLPALGETGPQLEEAATGSVELTRAVADFYNSVHVWDRADMTVGRAQQMLLSESAGAGGAVVLRSAPKAEGGTIQAFAVSYTHERTDAPADVLLGYDTALPAEEAEAAVRALLAMLVAQYPVQLEVDDSMTAVLAVLQPLLASGLAQQLGPATSIVSD